MGRKKERKKKRGRKEKKCLRACSQIFFPLLPTRPCFRSEIMEASCALCIIYFKRGTMNCAPRHEIHESCIWRNESPRDDISWKNYYFTLLEIIGIFIFASLRELNYAARRGSFGLESFPIVKIMIDKIICKTLSSTLFHFRFSIYIYIAYIIKSFDPFIRSY